jgi:hypothetical protein
MSSLKVKRLKHPVAAVDNFVVYDKSDAAGVRLIDLLFLQFLEKQDDIELYDAVANVRLTAAQWASLKKEVDRAVAETDQREA